MTAQPRIGCFVYNGATFWSMLAHGVTTRAAEFGATVEVLSAHDAAGQDTMLAQLIGQRVDALVVGVIDMERAAHSARAAAKAGIPVIAVVSELPAGVARSTIRVDDIGGAQLGAAHLAEMIGGQGAVVHLQGELEMRTAVNRAQGFRTVMARYPQIHVVYEGEGTDWSHANGQQLMSAALLAHPETRAYLPPAIAWRWARLMPSRQPGGPARWQWLASMASPMAWQQFMMGG